MERSVWMRLAGAGLLAMALTGCSGTTQAEKAKENVPPPPIPGTVGPGVGGAAAPSGMPGGAPVSPR